MREPSEKADSLDTSSLANGTFKIGLQCIDAEKVSEAETSPFKEETNENVDQAKVQRKINTLNAQKNIQSNGFFDRKLQERSSAENGQTSISLHREAADNNKNCANIGGLFTSATTGIEDECKATILTATTEKQKKAKIDELGMNKLRFSSLGLCGREEETKLLKACLSRLTSVNGSSKELIFISGNSGTGKSALAETLQLPVKRKQGTFISGKFDQIAQDEPYSAFRSICHEICKTVVSLGGTESMKEELKGRDDSFEVIRKEIIDVIDSTELQLLSDIVPNLSAIIGRDALKRSIDFRASHVAPDRKRDLETKTRSLFAFLKFIRILSLKLSPLVVVIDDIQWADSASIEAIKFLMADRETRNLMIVGCYRSNEVDETHILSRVVRDLKGDTDHYHASITEIEVGNLSIADVNRILMVLLNMDDESDTMPLARLCHKRTLGNAFFLLSFVNMLHEREIIEYNMGIYKWVWNIENVEKKTAAASNVVELLKEKMKKMTSELNQLLQMAACLGNKFEKETLQMVWTKLSSSSDLLEKQRDELLFDQLLDLCVDEGYLEKLGSSSYHFLHDKVQEAAMSLSPSDKSASLQHDIGAILLSEKEKGSIETNIFVIANLLNNRCAKRNAQTAEINFLAAERAKTLSAFSSAAQFVSKGIEFLPHNAWKNHQQLTACLYSMGAEAESCLGNTEKAQRYCKEVVDQPNLSVLDKIRAYQVSIEIKGSMGEYREALKMCLDVLTQSGCKFSRYKLVQGLYAITGLRRLQRVPPKEEIINKPLMCDSYELMSMRFMTLAGTLSYHSGNHRITMLAINRSVLRTWHNGMCDESPMAIAALGMILLHTLGKVKEGVQWGEIALSMMGKTQTTYYESRSMYVAYTCIFGWVRPLTSLSQKYIEGYRKGMKAGDTEYALLHIYQYLIIHCLGGKSLAVANEDLSLYVPQMHALKKEELVVLSKILWQAIQNLSGMSNSSTKVTGEIMDEDKLLTEEAPSGSCWQRWSILSLWKSFLCTYFGEHELGAEIAMERGDLFSKSIAGFCSVQFDPFYRSISLYSMARKTNKSVYKKQSRKTHLRLRKYVKNGFVNVVHQLKLLDAEKAALAGKKDIACALYQKASTLAVRSGFIQDAALSDERHAEFLLESNDKDDVENATYRLKEAIKHYSEWGANSKVEKMTKQYASHLE